VTTINTDAFRTLLETVPDGFFVHDESGRFLDVNAQSCADLGYSREELPGLSISDISRGADRAANAKRWADTPAGMAMRFREIAVRKDGSSFPVEISLTCQAIDGRKLFFGLARDVSEGDVALREANDRLSMAARVGGLGIWDYDIANDVLDCDDQWYRIMGRDPAERVRRIAEFREFVHPDDAAEVTEVDLTVARLAAEERDYGMLFRIFRPDGSMRWVRSSARLVEDGAGKPARAVGFVVDVTESRLAEQSLEQRASEDPLTGLANRRRLDDELVKACLHATRTGEPLSLAMIDVDHFKLYNDGEGHVRGDAALKALAGILQSVTRRPYDLAARYGGEEFLLLLPGVDEPEPILQRIAEELGALRIPHPLSPVAPHLTVSCGCVIASELADIAPLDLLAACDRALYQAKQGGRDRVEIARL